MGNTVCPWWIAYTFDNPLRTLFHKTEHICAPYVQEGMTVADIGCGMGYFSIGLAKIVKDSGKVIAVDIQKKMLEKLAERARAAQVSHIIHTFQCGESDINIHEPLDFALAFWMVHETPDKRIFLEQIYSTLKPSGLFLITEPKFHVSAAEFKEEIAIADTIGYTVTGNPRIKFSYAAVFKKRN